MSRTAQASMVLRKIVSLAVPTTVAVAAFLHAQAIGSLVDGAVSPSSIAPFAEARAAAATASAPSKSADGILGRNAFDHVTGGLLARDAAVDGTGPDELDPAGAPPCDGVRVAAAVQAADVDASFAALEVRGKHVLKGRGGDIDDLRVVYIGADRVWLSHDGHLCQTKVFGSPPPPAPAATTPRAATTTPFEKEIAGKIAKTGPGEYQVDRGAIDRLLEAQSEWAKTPLVPEKEGDRVVGFRLVTVRPGSVLSSLGLESGDRLVSINGIEVTSTERMLEAYARLRTGTLDRLTIHLVRNGKPTNLDYVVR